MMKALEYSHFSHTSIEAGRPEANSADGPAHPLRGRALRLVLLAELLERSESTTADLAGALVLAGYPLGGRPSKVVADALRWEVRAGRVARTDRSRYRLRRVSVATAKRSRRLARRSRSWLVATTRAVGDSSAPPPWADLAWLWGNDRRPPAGRGP